MNAGDARWETPIRAEYPRSLELGSLTYDLRGVHVRVLEEHSQAWWTISFETVQGVRISTWESASHLTQRLPEGTAFLERTQSAWLDELGRGVVPYMDRSRHFVVSCYDQVIEVAAWTVRFARDGAPREARVTATTKAELLTQLARELQFPAYFGHNWDALFDCLCDLSWLPVPSVRLVHPSGFDLGAEQAAYEQLLADAVQERTPQRTKEPRLEVVWEE